MVLIITLVLSILAATLLGLRADIGIAVSRDINDANAFWAAESGLELAKALGQKQRIGFGTISKPVGYGTLMGSNVLSGVIGAGSYSVTIVNDPTWDNTAHALQKYIITAAGAAPQGRTQVVSSHAWLLNFAGYLHASHSENGKYFSSGDILDGPVYSDDELHLLGPAGPIFKQLVSLATNRVDYSKDGFSPWVPTAAESNAVWQGGLVYNVTSLDIQGQFGDHLAGLQAAAESGGLVLAGAAAADYNFNFIKDGSFTYSNRTSHAVKTNYLSALNGTIYVDGNVYAQGVVNGRVTLAAQHAINIVTDLVYESASGTNLTPWAANFDFSAVNDMLGLMAVDSVNVQGTDTINLHASLLVTSGGFNADNYTQPMVNKYINLFGGMSQYLRGAIGQQSGSFCGFHKNYKFDQRYVTEGPPCFPPSMYVFTSWQ